MFNNFVAKFIPSENQLDPELYKRHRFFIVSLLTTLLLSVFYVSFFYFVEFTPGVYIVAGYIASHFLFLYLSYKGTSLYTIGNLFALMTYLGFGYGSATSGGVSSAVVAWFLSTKVSSFWYASRRSGYIWSAITILTVVVFLILEVSGVEFKLLYNTAYKPYFSGTMHIGVLIYYVIVLKVYEDWKEESILQQKKIVIEKQNLMQAIAHDLRNPLQVLNFKYNRIKNMQNIEDIHAEISSLHSQTMKLEKITDELVSPVKENIKDNINITNLMDELLNIHFDEQLSLKNIFVKLNSNLDSPFVLMSEIKLQRILQNLISNSIKYSQKNTQISIGLTKNKKIFQITIADEGLGLCPNELEIIFERYSGVKNTPTDGEDSIGIGLSITKDLVESQNGIIKVESPGKNKGSTFTLEFEL